MARENINEAGLDKVVGGSIIFNGDCTTCGYNCNDQYKVVNLQEVLNYMQANKDKMSERRMISNMLAAGYLANP